MLLMVQHSCRSEIRDLRMSTSQSRSCFPVSVAEGHSREFLEGTVSTAAPRGAEDSVPALETCPTRPNIVPGSRTNHGPRNCKQLPKQPILCVEPRV